MTLRDAQMRNDFHVGIRGAGFKQVELRQMAIEWCKQNGITYLWCAKTHAALFQRAVTLLDADHSASFCSLGMLLIAKGFRPDVILANDTPRFWHIADMKGFLRRRVPLSSTLSPESDVAKVHGLAQRSERIARGNKLVRDIAAEICGGDAAHNAVPLDFLGAVQFVAAGNATSVKVSDPIDIFLDRPNEVTLHDLHVIDVEEQLDAGRIDGLDDLHSPGGVVAHVIVMVDFTV